MTKELIGVDSLSFGYGSNPVLENITFSISAGEILMLMGLNGSGKSTLINCVMGFLKPQSGNVYLNEQDTTSMSNNDRAHIVSYVPQDIGTNCSLNVFEYLSLGRIAHKKIYEIASRRDYDTVRMYAKKMNIEHLLNKNMNEISGGERQLAAITKSLVQETPAIVFDEPMAALDYKNQVMYLKLIDELRAEGKALLLSSHNPNHALALNAKVALLHNNSLETFGDANTVLTEKSLQRVYGQNIRMISGHHRNYCVFDL